MIEGTSLRLRPWHEDDLPWLTELRNNIALQSQLLSRVRGSGKEQTRQWLQARSTNSNSLLFIIEGKSEMIPMGYVQFIEMDPVDRYAKLGICLVPGAEGKGKGTEVLTVTFKYLYEVLAIRKIILEVRADNACAIRCYEKLGFTKCGVFTNHKHIEGRWLDIVLMECFLEDGKAQV